MQLDWLASESSGSPVFASQQACFYSKWFPNWSSFPALRVPTTLDQAGRKQLSDVSLRKCLSYLKELALLMFFGEWDHQTLVTYLCFIDGVCPASWLGDFTGLQRQESGDFGAFQRWLGFVWSWKWVQSGSRGSTGKSWPGNGYSWSLCKEHRPYGAWTFQHLSFSSGGTHGNSLPEPL